MLAAEILTGPIAIMLVGYAVGMIALAFAVQPIRLKLVRTIDEMVAEPQWNDEQRKQLFSLRDNSMSFLIGLLVPVAAVGVIIDDILKRDAHLHSDSLSRDSRYLRAVWYFFLSLAAANPIMGVVSATLMALRVALKAALRSNSTRAIVDEAVEEPTLIALERYAPSC